MLKSKKILTTIGLGLGLFIIVGCKSEDFKKQTFTATEKISSIDVIDEDMGVYVTKSTQNTEFANVTYFEHKNYTYDIAEKNGVLTIHQKKTAKPSATLVTAIKDANKYRIVIELPEKSINKLNTQSTNGDIVIDNVDLNSGIFESENGDITVDNISFKNGEFSTLNGDIKGTIQGNKSEYALKVDAKNGEKNIDNQENLEATKKASFLAANGDISINFSNK